MLFFVLFLFFVVVAEFHSFSDKLIRSPWSDQQQARKWEIKYCLRIFTNNMYISEIIVPLMIFLYIIAVFILIAILKASFRFFRNRTPLCSDLLEASPIYQRSRDSSTTPGALQLKLCMRSLDISEHEINKSLFTNRYRTCQQIIEILFTIHSFKKILFTKSNQNFR